MKSNKKDFEKTKHRVGKVKPGAVNKTDTSFKAKRVVIREQALQASDRIRDTDLLGRLQPTIVQCGHYNPKVRREAILCLHQKMLHAEDSEISRCVSALLGVLSRSLVDLEGPVRDAGRILTRWLFSRSSLIGGGAAGPLFDGWFRFLLLGLSHIDQDVRRDALQIVPLVLDHAPALLLGHTDSFVPALVTFIESPEGLSKRKRESSSSSLWSISNAFLKAYLEAWRQSTCRPSAPPVLVDWAVGAAGPLEIWKRWLVRIDSSHPLTIDNGLLVRLTTALLSLPELMDVWLDHAYLFKGGLSIGPAEREKLRPFAQTAVLFHDLYTVMGHSSEEYWQGLPRQMRIAASDCEQLIGRLRAIVN